MGNTPRPWFVFVWSGKSPRASESLRGNGAIPIAENESGPQLFSDEEHGIAIAESGLEITLAEGIKNSMGDEHEQPEGDDGNRVMMEVVVSMPSIRDFIECIVSDLPAGMAKDNGIGSRQERAR